ncbi:MAG: DUF4199 domain-containing protein [Saprospiraceae bacterium]|nr:DUF4199 domain-containing protein [Saprospiraceae bacterium]
MDNISTRNGLFAGISAIIIGLVIYLISPMGFLSWGGWITIIPVVYFMVAAAKTKREEEEGFISLRAAFTASWLVYLLYSLISVLFTYVMMNIVDPSLIDTAKQVSIEAIEKMSGWIGEQGTEAAIAELENKILTVWAIFSLAFL